MFDSYSFIEYEYPDDSAYKLPHSHLLINGTENIALFLYDLIFNKKNSFELNYVADSYLADVLYKLFGENGFWIKKDKISILINDLIFSSDIKLKSSNKRIGLLNIKPIPKNIRYQYTRLFSKINDDGNSFDDVIKIINNYMQYAIPKHNKNFNLDNISVNPLSDTYDIPFVYV